MTKKDKQEQQKLERLTIWQERMEHNKSACADELARMQDREDLYLGTAQMRPVTDNEHSKKTPRHVRNIIAENIESMISTAIPQPKVTPVRKEDEGLARTIEDMIRNELNRMPMGVMNDLMERMVPIQGGGYWLVEWDNTARTHKTVGDVVVNVIHPKQIIPQDGVYTGIEDMDYVILMVPQTKEYIRRRYGVNVEDESESNPEVKTDDAATSEDVVTQYIAYYRNDRNGIGVFSWVNDTVLEDLDDYQARRMQHCKDCGAVESFMGSSAEADEDSIATGEAGGSRAEGPAIGQTGNAAQQAMTAMIAGTTDEELRAMYPSGMPLEKDADLDGIEKPKKSKKHECPYCGCTTFVDAEADYQEVYLPIDRNVNGMIPGAQSALDAQGMPYLAPTRIPFYKPNAFPLILQKNISAHGRLLGLSDVDKVKSIQNSMNRMETKVVDRFIKAGSRVTLPDNRPDLNLDPEESEVWRMNPAEAASVGVYDFKGDLQYEMLYINQLYEEMRQILGITDSYLGRNDTTATSGKAKQFAAAQSAGRLESKRIMKNAAFAALFKLIFQFKLAYADEPRPVVSQDFRGDASYDEFNRYDFLAQDETGTWYWNDQFLFSCDTSATLANNCEQMWQETTALFQAGTFGDPSQTQTRLLYWTRMAQVHYPGAEDMKTYFAKELEQEQIQQQQMMQMMQAQQAAGSDPNIQSRMSKDDGSAASGGRKPDMTRKKMPGNGQQMRDQAIRQAQADAQRDIQRAQQVRNPQAQSPTFR